MPQTSLDRAAANRRGAVFLTLAMACFSCGDVLLKLLSERLPTGQIIVVRGLFAALFVAGAMAGTRAFHAMPLMFRPLVLARGVAEGLIIGLYVSAVAFMPLGDITAIAQSTPLLMTAFAAVFFGESVGWRRWAATLVGFGGVLFVARPTAAGFSVPVAMAIGAALATAARDLVTRFLPSNMPSVVVTAAATLSALLAGALISLRESWASLEAYDHALLASAAAATSLGNFCSVVAFRTGEISVIAPFRYLVILFALVTSAAIWGQTPDLWSTLGIALIVWSGLYTIHRERVRAREALGP